MSQLEKARIRLASRPKDYTYTECCRFLGKLGFKEYPKGKTSGSRVKFFRQSDGVMFLLHKPHPGDIMSPGAVDDLVKHLKEMGEL